MSRQCIALRLAPVALGLIAALTGVRGAGAQITIDGSLSPAQTLTGPSYTIPSSLGQIRGSNLFHSFGRFNINTGESALLPSPLLFETESLATPLRTAGLLDELPWLPLARLDRKCAR